MSSDVAQLIGRCNQMATAIPKATRRGVIIAAQATKTLFLADGERARIPKRWSVQYKMGKGRTLDTDEAVIFYKGAPVYWTDQGTKPHEIGPKKGTKALKLGDRYVHGTVRHPGARKRPFFDATAKKIPPLVKPIIGRQVSRSLTEVFK